MSQIKITITSTGETMLVDVADAEGLAEGLEHEGIAFTWEEVPSSPAPSVDWVAMTDEALRAGGRIVKMYSMNIWEPPFWAVQSADGQIHRIPAQSGEVAAVYQEGQTWPSTESPPETETLSEVEQARIAVAEAQAKVRWEQSTHAIACLRDALYSLECAEKRAMRAQFVEQFSANEPALVAEIRADLATARHYDPECDTCAGRVAFYGRNAGIYDYDGKYHSLEDEADFLRDYFADGQREPVVEPVVAEPVDDNAVKPIGKQARKKARIAAKKAAKAAAAA